MDMAELCRQQTNLTVKQIGLLERMKIVFPFLADLVLTFRET